MKALIIYHANCNDGFGAAWVTYNALRADGFREEDITLHPATYGETPPIEKIDVSEGADEETYVYVVDFSYPSAGMHALSFMCTRLFWIDHHKTAMPLMAEMEKLPNVTMRFSVECSGAWLTWKFFHPSMVAPALIEYIQDRDLWKFQITGTNQFHLALNTVPKTIVDWNILNSKLGIQRGDPGLLGFLAEGAAIERYTTSQMEAIISAGKHPIKLAGIDGLCCNSPYAYASDIGHILAKESGTFGATWYQDSTLSACFSLRSVGDFDVSEIAKKFGGGGHKNAAGFKLAAVGSEKGAQIWNIE